MEIADRNYTDKPGITANDSAGQPFGVDARISGYLFGAPFRARVKEILPAASPHIGYNHITVIRESDGAELKTPSNAVTVLDRFPPVSHPPTVRMEAEDGGSSPVEASIQNSGEKIRILSDPDSMNLNGAWLTRREAREFALELLGLCDAADAIYGPIEDEIPDER